MNRAPFESPQAQGEMRSRPPNEGVPEIAVVKTGIQQRNETPIVPDSVIYYGSGAVVVLVFLGLCIMAYMLIFSEGGLGQEMEELYSYL